MATRLVAFNSLDQSSLAIDFIAKSPRAHVLGISGISTALLAFAAGKSVEIGSEGRCWIDEGIGADRDDSDNNPAALYAHLGFRTVDKIMRDDGVEWYEVMEISAQDAEKLLGRFIDGV